MMKKLLVSVMVPVVALVAAPAHAQQQTATKDATATSSTTDGTQTAQASDGQQQAAPQLPKAPEQPKQAKGETTQPAQSQDATAQPVKLLQPKAQLVAPEVKEAQKGAEKTDHEMAHPEEEHTLPLPMGWQLRFNGFVRMDASYATYQTFHITSDAFVLPEGTDNDHPTLDFTARNTRLRMTLAAPRVGHWNTDGIIEIDFFGDLVSSGTAVRQPMPRMRLAYVQLARSFGRTAVTFQFGNAWMVAAPQFASSIDPFNLWTAGNLWMRYPQIKFDSKYQLSESFRLELAGSVGQNMGGDGPKDPDAGIVFNGGIGERTGTPVYQGRFGLGFRIGKAGWSTVGVSGSFQKWNLTTNVPWLVKAAGLESRDDIDAAFADLNGDKYLNSWFFSVDANVKVKFGGYGINLKGEYHQGQGIGIYWGAALNNIQFIKNDEGLLIDAKAVPGMGFFGDLSLTTPFRTKLTLGYGLSKADKDYVGAGKRLANSVLYGVVTYTMTEGVILGASYEYRATDYKDAGDGETDTGDLDSHAHVGRIMVSLPF